MNDKNNYIEVLIQSLKKKNQVLDSIIRANHGQKEALEDPNLDPDDFDVIVEEKSALMDQLNQLDDGFEQIYARVREELQEHRENYKDEIHQMKELIRQLTDKSTAIQAQELRNKDLMSQKFASIKKQVREIRSSQKVVNQYYKNMMKTNYIDPQFTDSKK